MALETSKTRPHLQRRKTKKTKKVAAGNTTTTAESIETAPHEPTASKRTQVDVGELNAMSAHKSEPTDETTKKSPRRRQRSKRKLRAVPADQAAPAAPPPAKTEEPKTRKTRRGRSRKSQVPKPAQAQPPARPGQIVARAARNGIAPFTDAAATRPHNRPAAAPSEAREMVINVSAGYECRVAVLHEGKLEEIFIERTATLSNVGSIYKAIVTNVEPSIQAAFIDFGGEKSGFLHISDVQPQYFPNHSGQGEDVGRKTPRHSRPPIQKCFRRGQEVIVQITKEGVGTKGPTLTTYVSIPGRFLVMMPGMSRHGVSRKIEDDEARRRMRDVMKELEVPPDMGCILRTVGLDRPKRDLQRDLNYLQRLWKTVADRVKRLSAPAELYRESDLVTRTIRDVYTSDFTRIVTDHEPTARRAKEFLRIVMPRTKVRLELYTDREPLFHKMGIEDQLEKINMRHVPLPSGGSIVIDSTEALVAIDVNSGRFRSPSDAEETALRINLEAAEEIARQLRLRDLGGLIVCDFIDMRLDRNKRKVESALREALKKHKERARALRMSAFGLIEMTRQRQGPSMKRSLYHDCPACHGTGLVKMPDSVILDALRVIQLAANRDDVAVIRVSLAPEVAFKLLNAKRSALRAIETETGKSIHVVGQNDFTADALQIECEDRRGREIVTQTGTAPQRPPRTDLRPGGAKPRP